jgi:hypothetical protein
MCVKTLRFSRPLDAYLDSAGGRFRPGTCLNVRFTITGLGHLSYFLRIFDLVDSPAPLFKTPALQHAELMDKLRRLLRGEDDFGSLASRTRRTLIFLLRSCSSFRSSDERDMLYALLNVASPTVSIKPNYNISPREMWIAAFKALIRSEERLVLFEEAFYFPSTDIYSLPKVIPSWVNFARGETILGPDASMGLVNRSARVPHMLKFQDVPQETPNKLTVKGVSIGFVSLALNDTIAVHDLLHMKPTKWSDKIFRKPLKRIASWKDQHNSTRIRDVLELVYNKLHTELTGPAFGEMLEGAESWDVPQSLVNLLVRDMFSASYSRLQRTY